ncbi:hypothetical protein [Opitutus sp. ER46]|uniref:hypothetical protein n=1 Tax=Opitutus sp. ER46 TaxID=2161864 RepID=UPI000D30A32C|nr:hypothetical protein [Opitutus sp. ER46]PTX95755.1 hypothetical protein DB354_10110 [Opitutus sp. ER46]
MNNTRTFRSVLLSAIFFAFLVGLLCVFIAPAQADTAVAASTSAVTSATLDTAAAVATPFIVSFASSHPWLVTVLTIIATMRLIFKPVMSVVQAYVKSTASQTDDAALAKVETSTAYKIAAWLLDYLGSIKVSTSPAVKPADTPAAPQG